MENKVEQSRLDEAKQMVEQEIAEYLKDHPAYPRTGWWGRYCYLNNFDIYLQDRPGTAMDRRDWMLRDELVKIKTFRQLFTEQGKHNPEELGFSKRYLDTTPQGFVSDIDKAMEFCGITLDQVTVMYDEANKLQDSGNEDGYEKAMANFVDTVLPVYIYMRALGYNKYPELTS